MNDGASRLADAEAAFRRQAFEEAIELALAITRDQPKGLRGWTLLAEAMDRLGRTSDAIAALEQAIAHNPRDSGLHNRLAAFFHKSGDAGQAESHLRQAVEIDPAYTPGWNNLAKTLAQGGKLAEAEQAFRSALAAAPEHPLHLLELAKFVLVLGRLPEAQQLMDRAEASARSPAFAVAPSDDVSRFTRLRFEMLLRMGDAYLQSEQIPTGLGYLEQAIHLGAGAAVQDKFIGLLLGVTFSKSRPSLKPILQRSLEEHWADANQIGRFSAKLLLLEPDVQALSAQSTDGLELDSEAARAVLTDPLLLSLLERAIVADPALERLLAGVRRAILRRATGSAPASEDEALLPFFAALANQGFATEYAWPVSEAEAAAVAELVKGCSAQLALGQRPEPLQIAVVAAYEALHEVLDAAALLQHDWPAWLEPVIARQVREPLEEIGLKDRIPVATAIRAPGSRAVQSQYEDNPFPRWSNPPARRERQDFSVWIRQNFPAGLDMGAPLPGVHRQGLVAGCGTGQETAALSLMLSDVDWFAIDLSRASLAHAMRKSAEMGLDNVTFACADLLELRGLERSFDFVVSAGVLHHLDDPVEGWRTLRDVTRPGGVMLIALYSTAARRHLAAARAFAQAGGYGVAPQELRRYRTDVLALAPSPWREDLLNRDDFYSLSMLRDLVFHARETCFDIPRIEAALKALDLRFCGFATSAEITRQFQARFGKDADLTSLTQWNDFEAENPDAFWHMYHFLVQRT